MKCWIIWCANHRSHIYACVYTSKYAQKGHTHTHSPPTSPPFSPPLSFFACVKLSRLNVWLTSLTSGHTQRNTWSPLSPTRLRGSWADCSAARVSLSQWHGKHHHHLQVVPVCTPPTPSTPSCSNRPTHLLPPPTALDVQAIPNKPALLWALSPSGWTE